MGIPTPPPGLWNVPRSPTKRDLSELWFTCSVSDWRICQRMEAAKSPSSRIWIRMFVGFLLPLFSLLTPFCVDVLPDASPLWRSFCVAISQSGHGTSLAGKQGVEEATYEPAEDPRLCQEMHRSSILSHCNGRQAAPFPLSAKGVYFPSSCHLSRSFTPTTGHRHECSVGDETRTTLYHVHASGVCGE